MSTEPSRAHRGSIFLEQAEVLEHVAHPGEQWILRVQAPECAARAQPGQFVHLQCDERLHMRRPLSIQRVDADAGWVEFLYKSVGIGTQALTRHQPGVQLSLLGPIGMPFQLHDDRPFRLLLGGGVGIPPMVFLADRLRQTDQARRTYAVLGSEVPFPFRPRPSEILWRGLPDGAIATMPLLEDWGIACRLTSRAEIAGAFPGFVTDLAQTWLSGLDPAVLAQVELYACGPHAMLEACAALAAAFEIPCQVSLEEFMACAVGGCAGCTVPVRTAEGVAMKRVCVDGPVFPAETVFPAP